MAKRLLIVVLFFPALFITFLQIIYEILKWLVTGHAFETDPLIHKLIEW